jgi:hypothetical protein
MANSESVSKSKSASTLLGENTKGKVKETALKTIAHVGLAVIGGGLATAIIGKPSFLLGLGLVGYGYYSDHSWVAPLGIGMMASSHLVPNESPAGVSGFSLKQETENAKSRLLSFKDSLLSKTYIDKVIKPQGTTKSSTNRTFEASSSEETTSGFGSVDANLQALNQIEQQLVSSAMAIQNQQRAEQMPVNSDAMNGFDEMDFSGL